VNADNWPFNPTGSEAGMDYLEVSGVRVYDARSLVPLAQYTDGGVEKTGYTVHHDAVPFGELTIGDEVARIQAIDQYHRNHNGWPGIGYHRVIAPSGRTYLVGSSSTQRAHVAGLNHLWIGYCLLGDWTDLRPPEEQMHALRVVTQWETDMRGVPMEIAPHKRVNLGSTACPGGWAAVDAWAGLMLQPGAPVVPPLPPAQPHPPIDPRIVHARDLLTDAIDSWPV
jgi:hypothetical protein